jgi:hypothetical protein
MTLLQGLTLALFVVSAVRIIQKYHRRSLPLGIALFWLTLLAAIVAFVFFPQLSDQVAELIGIGRGVDIAFFVAIVLNFYISFYLYQKIDRLDRDITRLNRSLAKRLHQSQTSKKP